jgi:hypothetical protein
LREGVSVAVDQAVFRKIVDGAADLVVSRRVVKDRYPMGIEVWRPASPIADHGVVTVPSVDEEVSNGEDPILGGVVRCLYDCLHVILDPARRDVSSELLKAWQMRNIQRSEVKSVSCMRVDRYDCAPPWTRTSAGHLVRRRFGKTLLVS